MRRNLSRLLAVCCLFVSAVPAFAAVTSKAIDYADGDTPLRGYLYWDDAAQGKRPGVLVVHEWWGLNDYAKNRAQQLAGLGYVAFALDMYGAGKVTRHPDEAGAWMKTVNQNIDAWVRRATAGLNVLKQQPLVDTAKLAAIGYCFGGATVQQLAYAGADLAGVVSFHGAITLPSEAQYGKIKTRILIAHGNADPFATDAQLDAMRAALDRSGADWDMLILGGAKHGFTNPEAGSYGMDALAYDEKADHRSWKAMLDMFDELFGKVSP